MRIEAARQAVADLPMTATVQARLRETARLYSTHYSTQIEGNRLSLQEAAQVVQARSRFKLRAATRDEAEVLGYYRALDELDTWLKRPRFKISETTIKTLHARVMGGTRRRKPTPYRDGQNVIRGSLSGRIVYLPPETKDVPTLMRSLVEWLASSDEQGLPCPIRAALAHYEFATIHPYYDGNGRTARLLTTLVLHLGGYGLKGFYSLEEYYARDLSAYYEAISVGPSHNYYEGRADADVTSWVEYFCAGMAESFESVQRRAKQAAVEGAVDQGQLLRELSTRQRRVLVLFKDADTITATQIAQLLGVQPRTARGNCQSWVESGFLKVVDPAKKSRRYALANKYRILGMLA